MSTPIILKCETCGRSMNYRRGADPSIPPTVVKIVTSLCDECDNGDFGGETWYDAAGNEVIPN